MFVHGIGSLLFLALLIGGAVPLVRLLTGESPRFRGPRSGLEILEERYARGETDRDAYLQKKRDLTDHGAAA